MVERTLSLSGTRVNMSSPRIVQTYELNCRESKITEGSGTRRSMRRLQEKELKLNRGPLLRVEKKKHQFEENF